MPYSLTSASALGLDLVRTPGGAAAAEVLVRALLVEPGRAVPVVGAAPPDLDGARRRALAAVTAAGPGTVRLDEPPPTAPADALTVALQRLRRHAGALHLGTVQDVLDLAAGLPVDASGRPGGPSVGGLLLRPADEVALGRAVADGVLAALVGACDDAAAPVLAHALTRALGGGHVLPAAAAPGDALPEGPLRELVRVVAGTDPRRLVRLGATEPPTASVTHDAPGAWASAMHEASWAVELTGRTRLAATAQLELVRALVATGTPGWQAAAGTWNRCSGAVHALVVADLVGEETLCALHADLADDLR